MSRLVLLATLLSLLGACASTTRSGAVGVERKQFLLVSSQQAEAGADQFYAQEKRKYAAKGALNANAQQTARVRAIADRLIPHTATFRPDARSWNWEVNVFSSKEINAYCAAGGKIGVYTGLIDNLKLSDNELAAVMGHEIAHALREHVREAMSEAYAEQIGVSIVAAAAKLGNGSANLLANATRIAIGLPFSRQKEREADEIGLELMARAGYDPRSAISVWNKMLANGGGRPPEFLSTHPDPANRIRDIEAHLPAVMPLYVATQKKH